VTTSEEPFYNLDLPAATGANKAANFVLDFFNSATGDLLSLELQALEAENRGAIISNPRVVTSNQKPAVILQGTQIPFVTPAAGNTPATVTFKDAFLCLLVDPQILNNDSIILTVEVQKDAVGAAAALGNPSIDTKRIKTQVRIANGETAVLGGIFEKISRDDVIRVPFLGSLPFIGNFFKSTDKQDRKLELLIFLTPRIVDDRLSLR
jgi:type IV pilus assembly protein PilQ